MKQAARNATIGIRRKRNPHNLNIDINDHEESKNNNGNHNHSNERPESRNDFSTMHSVGTLGTESRLNSDHESDDDDSDNDEDTGNNTNNNNNNNSNNNNLSAYTSNNSNLNATTTNFNNNFNNNNINNNNFNNNGGFMNNLNMNDRNQNPLPTPSVPIAPNAAPPSNMSFRTGKIARTSNKKDRSRNQNDSDDDSGDDSDDDDDDSDDDDENDRRAMPPRPFSAPPSSNSASAPAAPSLTNIGRAPSVVKALQGFGSGSGSTFPNPSQLTPTPPARPGGASPSGGLHRPPSFMRAMMGQSGAGAGNNTGFTLGASAGAVGASLPRAPSFLRQMQMPAFG